MRRGAKRFFFLVRPRRLSWALTTPRKRIDPDMFLRFPSGATYPAQQQKPALVGACIQEHAAQKRPQSPLPCRSSMTLLAGPNDQDSCKATLRAFARRPVDVANKAACSEERCGPMASGDACGPGLVGVGF
jgi:hypothetical protein